MFLQISAGGFALAAVGGLILAMFHFREQNRPWALSLIHMGVAAVSLVFLILGSIQNPDNNLAFVATLVMTAVALGGFLLLYFHATEKPLPSLLVIVHGIGAVSGFLCLIGAII